MPFLRLAMTPAIGAEQKRELAQEFTNALVRILHKDPEQCHIVFEEVEEDNWALAGELVSFRRKRGD